MPKQLALPDGGHYKDLASPIIINDCRKTEAPLYGAVVKRVHSATSGERGDLEKAHVLLRKAQ